MNIITVIPLSRSKLSPELSYFTSTDIPAGAVVTVPVRSKKIHAIVVQSKSAEDVKSDIKGASFPLRKLGEIKASSFFAPEFMAACRSVSEHYATTVGSAIYSLVSDTLLENAGQIAPPLPPQNTLMPGMEAVFPKARAAAVSASSVKAVSHDKIIGVQGDEADRFGSWRSLIRQEFAKRKSVAIYVPTVEDCERIYAALQKGIEGYIYKLYGSQSEEEIKSSWKKISEEEHPIVVIATGSFSVLPRGDIDTIVIEHENGRGWISERAPYIDSRYAIEIIARYGRQTLYIADAILRAETLYRLERGEIAEGSPFKWRSISSAKDILVNMKAKAKVRGDPESDFRLISPELESLIRTNKDESTHMMIWIVRRGLSTITVCDDCETIVLCRNCSKPVVLHEAEGNGRRFFMCHICGERRSAEETCVTCGGWRLTPLGTGIQSVEDEIKRRFADVDIFKVDSDTTKTEKQIRSVMDRFRARPGSVIIGTELLLNRLTENIEYIAIASLDSLFALPDFRIQEKIMAAMIKLRNQATRSFLVQTRKPDEKVFEYGLKGNLSGFYKDTLADRKSFFYPPFATLVKLSLEGKKETVAKRMLEIQDIIAPKEVDIFPAFTSTAKGKSIIHGLIKVDSHAWPDAEIVRKLRSLPPDVKVKINPETLL